MIMLVTSFIMLMIILSSVFNRSPTTRIGHQQPKIVAHTFCQKFLIDSNKGRWVEFR